MAFVLKFECFYVTPNLDPESNYLDWQSGRFSNGNFFNYTIHKYFRYTFVKIIKKRENAL